MLSSRQKLRRLASYYLSDFTLAQVHNFAMVLVLLFTILFAYLLTQEEYWLYEKQLRLEHEQFIRKQHQEIEALSNQMALLMEYELEKKSTTETLERISAVFTRENNRFVQLFDAQSKALFAPSGIEKSVEETDALPTQTMMQIDVRQDAQLRPALAYVYKLKNGYTLLSGIYTLPSEVLLLERQEKLKSRLIKIVLGIVTFAFILFGIMFAINKIISALMQRDIESFLSFFEGAAHHDQVINYKQIFFKELRTMGTYANEMAETIMSQKNSLQELNASLEDKVKSKTLALEMKNLDLQKAQHFSQSLLDAQKTFLRHAIHETSTPLSVIMTSIELFTMRHGKDRQLSKIDAAVKNIFSIYDDLSYLVKKDQVEYPRSAINLDAYLQSRIDFFDEVAQLARLHFHFEPCTAQRYIYFNETKLQRIVDNNITNAIKYTLPSETITLKTSLQGAGISFEIFSRSKKIQNTQKIFEPYYREEQTINGFGLGLDLVHSICKEEGVSIEIDSSEALTRFRYNFKVMGS
jgi:signal transduction histidine kinase